MADWIKVNEQTMQGHIDMLREEGEQVHSREMYNIVVYFTGTGHAQDEQLVAKMVVDDIPSFYIAP